MLLFDPIALDPTGKTKLGSIVPNRDASKLAVGIYAKGSEIQDFRIIDSRTGAVIGAPLAGLDWFGWARDERYAFLSPRTAESDAKQEPHKCYRHRLGGDRKDDELLIEMKDAKDYCYVFEPEDADYTVFETGDFYSNTLRIRPSGSRPSRARSIRATRFRTDATFRKDRIYFRTNDDAPELEADGRDLRQAASSRDWVTADPASRRRCSMRRR